MKCKGCKKRQVGCHSTCRDYQEYNKEMERRRKERYINNAYVDFMANHYNRLAKGKSQVKKGY